MARLLVLIVLSLFLMAGTAYAEMEAITEADMDDVSAQGLQVIYNDNRNWEPPLSDQNNNLDSVQLNSNAERNVSVWSLVNSAKSAVNVTANVLADGPEPGPGPEPPPPAENKSFSNNFSQSNENEAKNHVNEAVGLIAVALNLNKETQDIENTATSQIDGQNNNNNSVQLNNMAQYAAEGYTVLNVSTSAVNEAVNLFVSGDMSGTAGSQSNDQKATNMSNFAMALGDDAVAVNAEMAENTQTIDNGEAGLISDQDNNNNAVQINDQAQARILVESAVNAAQSSVNVAANIASMGDVSGSNLSQSTDSKAINHMNVAIALGGEESVAMAKNWNKETQLVNNGRLAIIEDQDNNNNSVQVNNQGQRYAQGILLENSALSATNAALNLMGTGNVSGSIVSQSNSQFASNFANIAVGETAIAANKESGVTQTINNVYGGINEFHKSEVLDQDNNNNSVQLNDNAQGGADQDPLRVDKLINAAKSAVNAGQNVMASDDVSSSLVSQSNTQYAGNHNNYAVGECALATNKNKQTQRIGNAEGTYDGELSLIEDQDNNNNSVQINDNAQNYAEAVFLENVAGSAVNTGMNALSAGDISDGSSISQSNAQCARNFNNIAMGDGALAMNGEMSGATQEIQNVHATIVEQDNNNNSVQLNNNAQRNIVVDKTINASMSAVNAGQNIMSVGDVENSSISQSNSQYAANHNNTAIGSDLGIAANVNKQTQLVHNCFCTDLSEGNTQDNNLNSVQLNNNAQQNAAGILVANLADSSANAALNIITAGTVTGSSITQSNSSTAVNFSNTATGGMAIAGNVELLPLW